MKGDRACSRLCISLRNGNGRAAAIRRSFLRAERAGARSVDNACGFPAQQHRAPVGRCATPGLRARPPPEPDHNCGVISTLRAGCHFYLAGTYWSAPAPNLRRSDDGARRSKRLCL